MVCLLCKCFYCHIFDHWNILFVLFTCLFSVFNSSSSTEKRPQASAERFCPLPPRCQPPHHGCSARIFGSDTTHGHRKCCRWGSQHTFSRKSAAKVERSAVHSKRPTLFIIVCLSVCLSGPGSWGVPACGWGSGTWTQGRRPGCIRRRFTTKEAVGPEGHTTTLTPPVRITEKRQPHLSQPPLGESFYSPGPKHLENTYMKQESESDRSL